MSQLKFKKQEVLDVIEHSIKNPRGKAMWLAEYGEEDTDKPTILLVGDDGVYIMTGGATVGAPIAYALGCNPEKDDGWWELKGSTFGGDDGAEYLGAEDMKKAIESHPSCKYLGFRFKGKNMEVFTV